MATEQTHVINFRAVRDAETFQDPYPHVLASDVLSAEAKSTLRGDFAEIAYPGCFPLPEVKVAGSLFLKKLNPFQREH